MTRLTARENDHTFAARDWSETRMKPHLRSFSRLILAATFFSFQAAIAQAEPVAITAQSLPWFHIGSSDNTAGKLTYLGGLELSSQNEDFGGLSGLRVSMDGTRLFAVSDHAHWLTAEIRRDDTGQMIGLDDATLTCICRQNGQPYGSKHWGDAEAVEIDGNRAYIAFERLNRINGYDLKDDFTLGPPAQATTSFKSRGIDYSDGLEALALVPAGLSHSGRFVAITEKSLNREGNNRAFIADENTIDEFAVTRSGDYSITDATFTPDGDLLVIERRFGLSVGIGIRIRRIGWADVIPGKTVHGEVLMEAGLASRIDNMEGITAWRDSEGRTRIAILSDDNYARIQRTLLLEFVLTQ